MSFLLSIDMPNSGWYWDDTTCSFPDPSKTIFNTDIINGIEKSSDASLKLAYETGEIMAMTMEEMSSKVRLEMKNQLSKINNDWK